MIHDLVEKYLMRPKRLREAIEAVVHDNDELLRMIKEYEENIIKKKHLITERSSLFFVFQSFFFEDACLIVSSSFICFINQWIIYC